MPNTNNNKSQSVSEQKQLEASSAFSIEGISVLEFTFKVYPEDLGKNEKLALNVDIAPQATKKSGGYSVSSQIDVYTTDDDESKVGFKSFAEILIIIKTKPDFDEALLKNAVAIAYSYLRPLIAQMTVMSKLPPLDLQPIDFSLLNVKVVNKEES